MIQMLFICLAAVCKAFADTIAHHKGGILKGDFWDMTKQGKFIPFTKYPLDGWHLSNSGMILFFILATLFESLFPWYIQIPISGVYFIVFFNLFYNKILR